MSRDLGQDVPDLEKLYARKLWADFSYPIKFHRFSSQFALHGFKLNRFATRATIYRSLRALRAQNPKKVSKRVFLGVCKKVPENIRKSRKIPEKVQFRVFFDFFGYFRGLFCRPPKRLFLRLFWDFGPGGPGDSCKWSLGLQIE